MTELKPNEGRCIHDIEIGTHNATIFLNAHKNATNQEFMSYQQMFYQLFQ